MEQEYKKKDAFYPYVDLAISISSILTGAIYSVVYHVQGEEHMFCYTLGIAIGGVASLAYILVTKLAKRK